MNKLVNFKRGKCSDIVTFKWFNEVEGNMRKQVTRKVQTLCPGCSKHFCLNCFVQKAFIKKQKTNFKIIVIL